VAETPIRRVRLAVRRGCRNSSRRRLLLETRRISSPLSDPRLVGLVPDYPKLVGRCLVEDGTLTIASVSHSVVVRIAGSPQEILGINSTLRACNGLAPLQDVMLEVPQPEVDEILRCLGQLTDAGLVVDARANGKHLLHELHRSAPRSDAAVLAIQKSHRWRDPRPPLQPALPVGKERSGLLRRMPSLSLSDPPSGSSETAVSENSLAQLLAWSYGSEGDWKPVASAGRLQPVVLHALLKGDTGFDLYWFDDEKVELPKVAAGLPVAPVADGFTQHDFVEESGRVGRAIVVLSIDPTRQCEKYGNRGALFGCIEIGAVLQQMTLSAKALSLTIRAIGGFNPYRLRETIQLETWPLLIVVVASSV